MVPKSAGGSNQRWDINRFASRGKVVRLGGLRKLEQGIGEAINAQDPKALQLAAHTLKGSMRYFGVNAAFDTSYKLESMGRDGEIQGAADHLAQLKQEVETIRPRLAEFIQSN